MYLRGRFRGKATISVIKRMTSRHDLTNQLVKLDDFTKQHANTFVARTEDSVVAYI
jgi:hypothetical protein